MRKWKPAIFRQTRPSRLNRTTTRMKRPKQRNRKSHGQKSRLLPLRPKPRSRTAAEDAHEVPGDGHASAAAGPAVRRLARQLGVDLRRVRPTGAGGRITAEDVRAHVRETNEQVAATIPRGVTPPGSPDTDEYGGVRIEKMSRMRQTIARNMVESYTTIPQLTNFDDADVTELEDMRQQSKEDYADRGIKLTAMPFLIKAVASSLKRHPMLNASVDMEENQPHVGDQRPGSRGPDQQLVARLDRRLGDHLARRDVGDRQLHVGAGILDVAGVAAGNFVRGQRGAAARAVGHDLVPLHTRRPWSQIWRSDHQTDSM